MIDTDKQIWFISLLLSCTVFAALVAQWPVISGITTSTYSERLTTSRVTLSLAMPAATDNSKADIIESKPLKDKPLTKSEKPLTTKPVAKALHDNEQNKIIPAAQKQTTSAAVETVTEAQNTVIEPLGNHYLDQLLSHIEQYKYYPAAARRRGINGIVYIRLQISPSGEVLTLEATGNQAVLNRAAKGAIESAQPLPTTNLAVPFIDFAIEYRLKG